MAESQPPHPTFNAMLICDNAIREEGTGKASLIGIFAHIVADKFPTVHPSLCVYVNLTDAEGDYKFSLELMRSDDMKVIGRGGAEVGIIDLMRPAEVVFELRGLLFERPGRYQFVLKTNDRLIGSKTFDVLKLDRGSLEKAP